MGRMSVGVSEYKYSQVYWVTSLVSRVFHIAAPTIIRGVVHAHVARAGLLLSRDYTL